MPEPAAGATAGAGAPIAGGRREGRNHLDARKPIACFLEEERGLDGAIASVVTVLLANRECPWRCIYCDLWKNTFADSVPAGAVPAQIAWALEELAVQPKTSPSPTAGTLPQAIKLYNSGSFFDPQAIPPEDFPAIAKLVSGFQRVVVESHPALIGEATLRFRDLLAPARLEVAMGLETAHPEVLSRLNKGMTLDQFARATALLKDNTISVRAFTLLQPPFLPEPAEALQWSARTLDFAFACGVDVAVIIPTRGGNAAMNALAEAGHFCPPKLSTLEAAAEHGCRLQRVLVLADLWDLEQFSTCAHCLPARTARLREINLRQVVPPAIQCQQCGRNQTQ